ncbi:mercuric reductase [Desulfobulbus rhabdoformis]|uniref:mercuric reductase n=1 Tax=Desulfobulbus rhabdoformis TaxID=34032 RepID=UPI0019645FF4|nr:mercuric reductase [Desulfobulbus rhabdoformis]MBM9615491.1 mercuric reductase [Desulfobulbus rhabdoformis]
MQTMILPHDVHNEKLVQELHPADWENPHPQGRYNLVVIGGGTAGLVTAAGAAGLGARVALIERHLLGGDCLNTGCVPSKALLAAARAFYDARNSAGFGLRGQDGLTIDFPAVMERMRRLRSGISPHDSAHRFRELGVDVYLGQARFVDASSVEVGGSLLHFDRAALCTGGRAAVPATPGLAQAGYLTNETIFSLTSLPKQLAIVGGGPIGCELAQAFARFGAQVHLLQRGPRLLPRDDLDASLVVEERFREEGIHVHLQTQLERVEKGSGGEKRLLLVGQEGTTVLEVEAVLVAAGRVPNIEGLDLELAGVASDLAGVSVDDQLRTTNKRIFAAGDICSNKKFTHLADAQARILLSNALFLTRQKVSRLIVPHCTYTDPEVAQVGLTAQEARAQGIEVASYTVPFADVDRALLDGEPQGFARVHLHKGSDTIVGGTVVGRHAGDLISELTLAMTANKGLAAIGRTIHPYPTRAEVFRKLADAYNKTRLTGPVKKIFAAWLGWRRKN